MNSSEVKVSIIIPVYNGANFLADSIDSALAQTYKNIEIIVVNDGSNDRGATEKIAKSYGNKIKYYKKTNGGVATALNLGIKKMTGDYFSWLSHDDMYHPQKIEKQMSLLNRIGRHDVIVACNIKILFPSGVKKNLKINTSAFRYIDVFLSTSAQVGLHGCSLLIPKKAFSDCGVFDPRLPVTQDYDLWFRMKDMYEFVLENDHLVISRRHSEQDSVKKQKLMLDAGDLLHYQFIKTTSESRFKEFLLENTKNFNYIYDNYQIYKERGYIRTASILLKRILENCYLDNQVKFHKLFRSEIDPKGLPDNVRGNVDIEYKMLRGWKDTEVPIRFDRSKRRKLGFVGSVVNSVRHDGVNLTTQRAARKIYRSLKS